jgi:hypothetical protein
MGMQGRGCSPRVEGTGEDSVGAQQVAGDGPQGALTWNLPGTGG